MRFVTWSMEGADAASAWERGVRPLFDRMQADLAGLQACADPPPGARRMTQDFTYVEGLDLYRWEGPRQAYVLHLARDALALVSFALPIDARLVAPRALPGARSALLAQYSPGARWYGTFDALPPDGADAPAVLAAVRPPAVVVGNYRRAPASFAVPGWTACPPNAPTFPARSPRERVDWLSHTQLDAVEGKVEPSSLSDHLPVLFDV